jgi:diguanylate cyclase (GGDEF)-like protein
MKRDEALRPLSREHLGALLAAKALREADDVDEGARAFLGFWRSDGRRHFQIEEEVLLPRWAAQAEPDTDGVRRMLDEHLAIRRESLRLEQGQAGLDELHELGRLLHDHVRFEERRLFPRIEEDLDADSLARLGEEIETAEATDPATHDPLTAIANRRSLEESLQEELERGARYGRPFSLLFIDLDRFKSINDRHGHAAGDAALQEFAAVLRENLRPVDRPSRWGGEEFVVLLPETGPEDACRAAERVRAAVAGHDFEFSQDGRITCSIGIGCYPDDGEEGRTLVKAADRALYVAKERGRNRVAR